jgi:16S rRNA (uracil1498-N3)-methyltransferase
MFKSGIRLYINWPLNAGQAVVLSKEDSHYLATVMRQKQGGIVNVFNERDGEYSAQIASLTKSQVSLTVKDRQSLPPPSKELTLFFAPIKNVDSSFIIQKATELGVTKIVPIICERSVIKKVNNEKLVKVARQAIEQCEGFKIPTILAMEPLSKIDFTKQISGDLIVCDERCEGPKLSQLKLASADNGIIIGPEGGFAESERKLLAAYKKAKVVSLGKRILRAETAIIAALAIYQDSFA